MRISLSAVHTCLLQVDTCSVLLYFSHFFALAVDIRLPDCLTG